MQKKQQPLMTLQNTSPQKQSPLSSQLNPPLAIKQNHLSSTHQHLLMYEQKNIEIQFMTKSTQIAKSTIQAQMKQPFVESTLKGYQIFQKYGSMIQNQPDFLKGLIFHNYLPYLPQKFQNQFSQIMLIGTGFEFLWWSSLAFSLIQTYRHRRADFTLKEKGGKFLGFGFLFIASSLGFYQHYYTPNLKKCYYRNIKAIDSMMDKHVKILESCGVKFEQVTPLQPDQNFKTTTEKPKQIKPQQTNPETNKIAKKEEPSLTKKQNT